MLNFYDPEVMNEFEKYKQFALDVFGYLNGKVNPDNPCIYYTGYFNRKNYAEYRKPNIINLYIGTMMSERDKYDEEIVKGIIILAITHELAHANQSACMIKYGIDPAYMREIENDAEWKAQTFLQSMQNDIKERFGVDITRVFAEYGLVKANTYPLEFDDIDYYVNTLIDMFMGDISRATFLYQIFMFDNVGIILDGEMVEIKRNGELLDSISDFNKALSRYRRGCMRVNLRTSYVPIPTYRGDNIDRIDIDIKTERITFDPIIT